MKREGWLGQLKTFVVSVWNKVVRLWHSFTGQRTPAPKEIKPESQKTAVWPSLQMAVPAEPSYALVMAGGKVGQVKAGDIKLAPDGPDGAYQLVSPLKVGEETLLQAVVRKEEGKIVFQTAIKENANGEKIYLSKDGQLFNISQTIHEREVEKQEIILIRENLQTELNQGTILQAGLMRSIYQQTKESSSELSLTEGTKQLYTLSVKNAALKIELKKNFQEADYAKLSLGLGQLVENKRAIAKLSIQEKEIYAQAAIIIAKTNAGYAQALSQVETMLNLGAQPEKFTGQEKTRPQADKFYPGEKAAARKDLIEASAGTFLLAKFGLINSTTKAELKSTQNSIIIGLSNLQPEPKISQALNVAIQGDFIEKPTLWNLAGQISAGLSPAGFLGDLRDVGANTKTVWQSKGTNGKLGLGLSLFGAIPIVGKLKILPDVVQVIKAGKNATRIETVAKIMLKEAETGVQLARSEIRVAAKGEELSAIAKTTL